MTVRDNRNKQVQLICEQITACAARNDEEEIVRIFLKALENHIITDMQVTLPWCLKALGPENTEFLIKSLAECSCPICKQGLEHCDLCNGSGMTGPEMVCEACIGLGVIPCRFCGGSGLSILETIPSGLKIAVIKARIKIATKHVETIKNKLKNSNGELEAANSVKKQGETLLFLNKLLSLLEVSLDETRQIKPTNSKNIIAVTKLSSECLDVGLLIKKLVKQVLQRIIKAEEYQIACNKKRDVKKIHESRLEFYRELLESTPVWSGTSLEHPILDSAIARIKGRSKHGNANNETEDEALPNEKPDMAA